MVYQSFNQNKSVAFIKLSMGVVMVNLLFILLM